MFNYFCLFGDDQQSLHTAVSNCKMTEKNLNSQEIEQAVL